MSNWIKIDNTLIRYHSITSIAPAEPPMQGKTWIRIAGEANSHLVNVPFTIIEAYILSRESPHTTLSHKVIEEIKLIKRIKA